MDSINWVEYRGRESVNPKDGTKIPAGVCVCLGCGAIYRLFFTAPIYVLRHGITEFEEEHKNCKVVNVN